VNPGLAASFPWLSGIAGNFQEWRLNGMLVEYISMTSPYGATADSSGTVNLSMRYDDSIAAPASLAIAENTDKAENGRPIDNILMAVECASASRPVNVLQVRTGGLPSGQNVQFTDQGIVDICNSGQADGNIEIGEIWFIYDVAFLKPIPSAESGGNNLSDHFQLVTCTSAANLGTASVAVATNAIGGKINAVGTTYTFPSYIDGGTWLFVINVLGGSATASSPSVAVTGGVKLTMLSSATVADQYSVGMAPQPTLAAVTTQSMVFLVNVTAPSCTVAVTSNTFAGTTGGDLFVAAWDANIITMARNKKRWQRFFKLEDEKVALQQEMLKNAVDDAVRNVLNSIPRFKALSGPLVVDDEIKAISQCMVGDLSETLRNGRQYDKCHYCGQDPPDHPGRDCPTRKCRGNITVKCDPECVYAGSSAYCGPCMDPLPESPVSIEDLVKIPPAALL